MSRLARWFRGEWSRVRGLAGRGERGERLDEEMRYHIEMLTARHIDAGLTAAEARRAALREFGGMDRFSEAARDEYRSRALEDLDRDVRRSVRNLVRAPAFTTAAIVTLGLGISATTVMFSIVDHVVLRPLAYRDADRLVLVREVVHEIRDAYPTLGANASHYLEWREQCGVCEDVGALRPTALSWVDAGEPVRLSAVRISANFFSLLGVGAQHGRLFHEDEDRPGSDVVVLSHDFWERRLGGDIGIVGRTITMDDRPRLVVGVLPAQFRLPKGDELGARVDMPDNPAVFIPLGLTQNQLQYQGNFDYVVVARLRPGVSATDAQAHLDAMLDATVARAGRPYTVTSSVVPLQEQVVGGSRAALLLLLAAVGAVLLLVCVNLANLLLARNAGRARESAVRVALGAGRGRLIRESLIESLVLALGAGLVGLVLAHWGLAALLQLAPPDLPRLHEIRLDGRVAGVAVLLALGTGFFFGVLPALRAGGADPADALHAGGRTQSGGRHATRARRTLIATQVALTSVLLVAAGLFLASFVRVLGTDTGFRAEHLLAADVTVPASSYRDSEELQQVFARIVQQVEVTPGVTGAALATKLPLEGATWVESIAAEDDVRPGEERPVGNLHFVTSDYFRVIGASVRRGRTFSDSDRGRTVAVLSARAAALVWPDGEDPVGRTVMLGSVPAEVVGVVGDVASTGIEEGPSAIVYLPPWTPFGFSASPSSASASIVVRTEADPAGMAGTVRAALRQAAAGVVIDRMRTMQDVVSEATAARRFQLSLLVLFAITAFATACVGIYGVIAHSLAQRRSEIGVRMAFGARRADIHGLVLREGLGAAAVGLLAGTAAIIAFGRLIQSMLYEVRPADPLVIAAVAVLLAAMAALASWVPARRASGAHVSAALREE